MDGGGLDTAGALPFTFGGAALVADVSGALWWPGARLLVVSDLHLEKASAYAARGQLLPPYDTRETIARLTAVIARYRPEHVVCLGDSFHDRDAGERLGEDDATALSRLMAGRRWTWIVGNHDPEIPAALDGQRSISLSINGLVLRHEASREEAAPEVSGHFHPKARVPAGGRRLHRPCFALGGGRLILPAFGAFTGGLDLCDPAIAGLIGPRGRALVLGRHRVSAIALSRLF